MLPATSQYDPDYARQTFPKMATDVSCVIRICITPTLYMIQIGLTPNIHLNHIQLTLYLRLNHFIRI